MKPFLKCNRGVALVEFGFVLPFLLLIMIGIIELSRYALVHQKLDKAAHSLADFVTQGTAINIANLDTYAAAINEIMEPLDFSGTIIFSSAAFLNNPTPPCTGNTSCITWQYRATGLSASQIGVPGGNAALPGAYQVLPGQNAIAVEVFYDYVPLLAITGNIVSSLAPHSVYKIAVYKPRQGTLTELQ